MKDKSCRFSFVEKLAVVFAFMVLFGGCVMQRGSMKEMSMTMVALNQIQPFVNERLAEKIARIIIEDKYPKDFFVIRGSASVVGDTDAWLVTFDNGAVDSSKPEKIVISNGRIVPGHLTIAIRKTDGAIVDIY
jgi:hypothetical protein